MSSARVQEGPNARDLPTFGDSAAFALDNPCRHGKISKQLVWEKRGGSGVCRGLRDGPRAKEGTGRDTGWPPARQAAQGLTGTFGAMLTRRAYLRVRRHGSVESGPYKTTGSHH